MWWSFMWGRLFSIYGSSLQCQDFVSQHVFQNLSGKRNQFVSKNIKGKYKHFKKVVHQLKKKKKMLAVANVVVQEV